MSGQVTHPEAWLPVIDKERECQDNLKPFREQPSQQWTIPVGSPYLRYPFSTKILRMRIARSAILILCALSFSTFVKAQVDGAVRRNLVTGGVSDGGTYMIILDSGGKLVPGNLSAKEKPGYITISGFTQLSEAATGEGPVSLGQVRITKSVGESSAVLLEALDEGSVLKQVDILVYTKKQDGTEVEEFRLKLEKVRVKSVLTRIKAGNARLPNSTMVEEEIALDYETITWLFDDGTSSYRADR